jgi:hypothetical protein
MRTLAVLLLLGLAGCSMSADTSLADAAVPQFHQMLDAGRFVEIYAAAAQDLKQIVSQQDMVALLEGIHRKLGDTRSAKRASWNVNYQTTGVYVTLVYTTQFAAGAATEQFVYHLQDHKALLAGYHINSNALLK